MSKSDDAVIEFAVRKFWKEKSDEDIALTLGTTAEVVAAKRSELSLERPKGTESLKDFARRYIMDMSDQEKKEFIKLLPADLVWRMSEGNPANSDKLDVKIQHQIPIMSLD